MSRILIIDDDDSIRESLDMYLTEEGYDVEVADSGWGGINKFTDARTELVILDIRLPDVSGFFVYDELRKRDDKAKIIMITAFHDDKTISEAMEKGVFRYIKKPIDMNILDLAIVEAMKQ